MRIIWIISKMARCLRTINCRKKLEGAALLVSFQGSLDKGGLSNDGANFTENGEHQ